MGFVQLFMCVATSFHGVAWPLITLIYPLYASVRAIESNSHAENRKWLTYWVLYGLIMVFEFTFAVLIEWLPLWPVIKLMVTCWLVVPSSDGAVHAYNHFVRPCFSVNTHAFGDWLKTQKDKFGVGKSNDFLLHVQLYVQENGFEALEKVIFSKDKCIQPNGSMTENNLVTSIKKEAESLEAIKLMESKVAQIGYGAGCDFLRSSFQKKSQKEWACALCQVCTTSEFNLQCHLQGKKHESKELELLAKKNAAKNKTASASYSKQVYVPKVTPRQGAPASVANDKYVNKLSGLQLNLMESKVAQIGYREVGATKNIATAVAEVAGGCCELPGVSFQKEAQFVLQCHLQGEKHKDKEIAKNKTVTKWQIRQRT